MKIPDPRPASRRDRLLARGALAFALAWSPGAAVTASAGDEKPAPQGGGNSVVPAPPPVPEGAEVPNQPPRATAAPGATDSSQPLSGDVVRPGQKFFLLQVPGDMKDNETNQEARRVVQRINTAITGVQGDPGRVGLVLKPQMQGINDFGKKRDLDPRVREQISTLNIMMGRPEDARGLSGVTIEADPDNRDALSNRAQANMALRQHAAAMRDADRLLALDPQDARAYLIRSLLRYAQKQYLAASEDAQRAHELNPDDEYAREILYMAKLKTQRVQPQLPPDLRALGDQIVAEGTRSRQLAAQVQDLARQAPAPQTPQAAAATGAAQAATPSNPLPGMAERLKNKDHWGAIREASRTLEEDPRNAQAFAVRSLAHTVVGECHAALRDADSALSIVPLPLAHQARADALNCLGRNAEAVTAATLAIAQDPQEAGAYVARARGYQGLRDTPSMLADLKKASEINPRYASEYQNARAQFIPPMPPQSSRSGTAPAGPPSTVRRYLVTLSFTVAGGLLIALGLLHLASSARAKRRETFTSRLREAVGTPGSEFHGPLHSGYKILRPIGQGGMGVVYEALDVALNRKVAAKKMRDEIKLDARERERFLEEARTVAALKHANIVEIYAILEEEADTFLIFEYVSGRPLSDWIAGKGRLSLAEARRVCRGVCAALEYAHARGVIHRDLKPANIMVSTEGEIKVMDFGIARHARDTLSRSATTGTVVGTPQYMAPEAEQGIVRRESDIYSLGACLYEMVTGRRPFQEATATADKLSRKYPRPSEALPGLPHTFDQLIDDALHPDPDRRIRTPSEFQARLERAAAQAVAAA